VSTAGDENGAAAIANADVLPEEKRFTEAMIQSRTTGTPAEAVLQTDDRVLARITDGIYRQPSSALRELISNAYDADATEVYVVTDAPRYSQIEVRDNGSGMDEEALSRLIHHIGGSSKRTSRGKAVGTTSNEDAGLSPGGRRLIGKIGIGLFSVSQLTSHFQIVTKQKGADHRLVADVILKTYVEDGSEEAGDGLFETGTVRVVSVPAEDSEAHGTQIILRQIRPRARDILRSRERWERYYEQLELPEADRDPAVSAPVYHSGNLAKDPDPDDQQLVFREQPTLPWRDEDSPLQKFAALKTALASQVGKASDRPEVATTFDNYLALLWTLSLAAPVRYLEKHPFDLTVADDPVAYELTNARGTARKIEIKEGQTIREAAGLTASDEAPGGGFQVFVDEVELRRPITFEWWSSERQAIQNPLIFVGKFAPDLSHIPESIRGGDLSFEAYLFWNSKIVPKENNGVLVRIHGASSAIFDDTFMKYQVSEQTRLPRVLQLRAPALPAAEQLAAPGASAARQYPESRQQRDPRRGGGGQAERDRRTARPVRSRGVAAGPSGRRDRIPSQSGNRGKCGGGRGTAPRGGYRLRPDTPHGCAASCRQEPGAGLRGARSKAKGARDDPRRVRHLR
jgi:hypothetical protein